MIITCDTLTTRYNLRCDVSRWPNAARDTTLDKTYNCKGLDRFSNPGKGILSITYELSGGPGFFSTDAELNITYVLTALLLKYDAYSSEMQIEYALHGDLFILPKIKSWVWYSKIGR